MTVDRDICKFTPLFPGAIESQHVGERRRAPLVVSPRNEQLSVTGENYALAALRAEASTFFCLDTKESSKGFLVLLFS